MSSNVTLPGAGNSPTSSGGRGSAGASSAEMDIITAGEVEKTLEPEKIDGEEEPEPKKVAPELPELDEEELPEIEDGEEELPELPEGNIAGKISFSDIKAKYPNLLKEFPQLRDNYFAAEKYRETFATVDDAKIAADKSAIFDELDPYFAQGDLAPIVQILASGGNGKALENIASTILPTLQKANAALYTKAMEPEFQKLLGYAVSQGKKTGNKNLENAAIVIGQLLWGPEGVPKSAPAEKPDPEKEQLRQALNQEFVGKAGSFEEDTKGTAFKYFMKEIETGLDPDGTMNNFTKDTLREKILDKVNEALQGDVTFQKQMQSLWVAAMKKEMQQKGSGFTQEMKTSIIRASLVRAKNIIPAIRQRLRAEALGKPNTSEPGKKKTNIPQASGAPRSKTSFISVKDAKKEGLSAMDIINR